MAASAPDTCFSTIHADPTTASGSMSASTIPIRDP